MHFFTGYNVLTEVAKHPVQDILPVCPILFFSLSFVFYSVLITGMSLIKLFLARNVSGISEFSGIFILHPEKAEEFLKE
jgi:hypothetical protein